MYLSAFKISCSAELAIFFLLPQDLKTSRDILSRSQPHHSFYKSYIQVYFIYKSKWKYGNRIKLAPQTILKSLFGRQKLSRFNFADWLRHHYTYYIETENEKN